MEIVDFSKIGVFVFWVIIPVFILAKSYLAKHFFTAVEFGYLIISILVITVYEGVAFGATYLFILFAYTFWWSIEFKKYKEENPGQNGGKPTFKEDGVKLRICYQQGVQVPDFSGKKAAGGTRPHPYIKQEIKIPYRKSEKATNYADNTVQHFDFIFGVHDDEHGLFGGMSKAEKANLKAGAESLKLAGSLLKSAVKGELDPNNIDPELQAQAEAQAQAAQVQQQ